MTAAIVVLAPTAPRSLVAEALRRRYGSDYDIIECDDADGRTQLDRLRAIDTDVVAVLALMRAVRTDDFDIFVEARRADTGARRIALVEVGARSLLAEVRKALTLGRIDMYCGYPWATPEEELYPVVGEALRLWAYDHQPRYEKAAIVDAATSSRGRHLHTWLERNNVPCAYSEAHSPEGRRTLEEV